MTAKIPNSAPLLANGRFSQEWTRFLLNVSSGGGGTVTTVSITPANGVSGTVTNPTTTPAIALALGNITPTQVSCSGPVSGTNLSGSNTGDQTISISGDVTAAGSTGVLSATVTKINGTSLAGLATGILKNTTTTGVPSIAAAGSDYLAPPAGTALLKANSGAALANAVAGTDYLAPPAGTSILKGNSGGALANATAGTDYVAPGGALGTPSSGTLTNCAGLPISTGVSGLGTGVATFLATPSSANLAGAITDETGSGALVFANTPALVTPNIGAATGTSVTVTGQVKSSGTAGVGYATGAGGTVTQATSKSTGVTLSKVCGQITMNGAALAANTTVSFTLTNTLIATTDTIDVHRGSVGTAAAYNIWVDSVGSGSCVICVRNISAGSLSEAIVLNFSICKAVNA